MGDEYENEEFEDDKSAKSEPDALNMTSRTVQEEEARLKAEQQEIKRSMFINVQPYVSQTLNLGGGYSNPFSFATRA